MVAYFLILDKTNIHGTIRNVSGKFNIFYDYFNVKM